MDQDYLNLRFIYRDGELFWKTHVCSPMIGKKVGTFLRGRIDQKRLYLKVDGKVITVHKAVWILHRGLVPEGLVIDHEDKNPFNNRIENLRLLTGPQNQLNTDKVLQAHNTSGYRGVRLKYPDRFKPWVFEINYNKKRQCFSGFVTAEEAAIARDRYIDEHNLPLVKNF